MRCNINIMIVCLIFFSSCTKLISIQSFESESIEVKNDIDSLIYKMIIPYQTEIDKQMDQNLCYTINDLLKEKPESTLGNFICDLSLETSNKQADVCVMNYGGLRSTISAGNITKRDIFKVMPFENELVILELNKLEFYQMLEYLTKRGGEPFSGMEINQKNDTILYSINNKDLLKEKYIRVLTTDYLANGGDKMSFFKNKKQNQLGIKLRDAIITYCASKDTININLDKRISLNE